MVIFKLVFRYAGIVGVSYHIKLYVVLGIKPGASFMLGKCSAN